VIDTLPLFDLAGGPVSKPTKLPASRKRPTWAPYKPLKSGHCDHCMTVAHEAKGPVPMRARYKRTDENGPIFLCGPHAQDQRERDALAFPATRGKK
jgi:hypothetical protein